eukprot:5700606-Pleurochrysis_carterae.AAC.6
MQAPVVRGMPFVTLQYRSMRPRISLRDQVNQIDGISPPCETSGRRFTATLANGRVWRVYFSESVELQVSADGKEIVSKTDFNGTMRLADVATISTDSSEADVGSGQERNEGIVNGSFPSKSKVGKDAQSQLTETISVLDMYASRVPLGGRVSATALGDTAEVSFEWESEGEGELLIFALPHHLPVLREGAMPEAISSNLEAGFEPTHQHGTQQSSQSSAQGVSHIFSQETSQQSMQSPSSESTSRKSVPDSPQDRSEPSARLTSNAPLHDSARRMKVCVRTIKGRMVSIVGERWTMLESLSGIGFAAPAGIDPRRLDALRAALPAKASKSLRAPDPYFAGKELAALARIALIADEIGEAELAKGYRGSLAEAIGGWMHGNNSDPLVYDTVHAVAATCCFSQS